MALFGKDDYYGHWKDKNRETRRGPLEALTAPKEVPADNKRYNQKQPPLQSLTQRRQAPADNRRYNEKKGPLSGLRTARVPQSDNRRYNQTGEPAHLTIRKPASGHYYTTATQQRGIAQARGTVAVPTVEAPPEIKPLDLGLDMYSPLSVDDTIAMPEQLAHSQVVEPLLVEPLQAVTIDEPPLSTPYQPGPLPSPAVSAPVQTPPSAATSPTQSQTAPAAQQPALPRDTTVRAAVGNVRAPAAPPAAAPQPQSAASSGSTAAPAQQPSPDRADSPAISASEGPTAASPAAAKPAPPPQPAPEAAERSTMRAAVGNTNLYVPPGAPGVSRPAPAQTRQTPVGSTMRPLDPAARPRQPVSPNTTGVSYEPWQNTPAASSTFRQCLNHYSQYALYWLVGYGIVGGLFFLMTLTGNSGGAFMLLVCSLAAFAVNKYLIQELRREAEKLLRQNIEDNRHKLSGDEYGILSGRLDRLPDMKLSQITPESLKLNTYSLSQIFNDARRDLVDYCALLSRYNKHNYGIYTLGVIAFLLL